MLQAKVSREIKVDDFEDDYEMWDTFYSKQGGILTMEVYDSRYFFEYYKKWLRVIEGSDKYIKAIWLSTYQREHANFVVFRFYNNEMSLLPARASCWLYKINQNAVILTSFDQFFLRVDTITAIQMFMKLIKKLMGWENSRYYYCEVGLPFELKNDTIIVVNDDAYNSLLQIFQDIIALKGVCMKCQNEVYLHDLCFYEVEIICKSCKNELMFNFGYEDKYEDKYIHV